MLDGDIPGYSSIRAHAQCTCKQTNTVEAHALILTPPLSIIKLFAQKMDKIDDFCIKQA